MPNVDDLGSVYQKTIRHYSDDAARIFAKYEATTIAYFDFLTDKIAPPPGRILDIGSGSGKDASIFAEKGYNVTAIEPADELRRLASLKHTDPKITWVADRLPALETLRDSADYYDHAHINCVLMHVSAEEMPMIMQTLHRVLKPKGTLYLSLRQGPDDPRRRMFPLTMNDITNAAMDLFDTVATNTTIDEERPTIAWDKMLLRKRL